MEQALHRAARILLEPPGYRRVQLRAFLPRRRMHAAVEPLGSQTERHALEPPQALGMEYGPFIPEFRMFRVSLQKPRQLVDVVWIQAAAQQVAHQVQCAVRQSIGGMESRVTPSVYLIFHAPRPE